MSRNARIRHFALLLRVCGLAPLLEARINIKPGFNSFSTEQDIQLGQESAKQVEKEFQIVNDAQLNDYISRLGKKLAAFAPGAKYPYQFKLVNESHINAFALPGGPIFVHTATVKAAANEAQLAGVIAHEISHVALRHSTNQASKAALAQAPLAILGGVLSSGGIASQLAQLGISFGVNSAFMKFSRSAESQADSLGSQIMYDAGYDPRAMAQFFQIIEKEAGGNSLEFFSDHPNPGNRVVNVQKLIPTLGPGKEFASNFSEFDQIRSRISNLAPPPAAPKPIAAGTAAAPVAPSNNMSAMDADFFSFQYPDNWQVNGQGTGAISAYPANGVLTAADGSLPQIAYGVLASTFPTTAQPGKRLTLTDATNQLLADLQKSNPNLRVLPNTTTSLKLGGQDALSLTAQGQSALPGEHETNWIVTSFRPEGLWYIVFISPEKSWNQYKPSFQKILDSVRFPK